MTHDCGLPLRQGVACTSHCHMALQAAVRSLATAGFVAPSWSQLARSSLAREDYDDDEPADLTRGCQRSASRAVGQACAASLTRRLDDPAAVPVTPVRCQSPYTALPTSSELRLEAAAFRVLLLRRVCREAGSTVSTNVLLRDLTSWWGALWGGAQLAVDTTVVSALDKGLYSK